MRKYILFFSILLGFVVAGCSDENDIDDPNSGNGSEVTENIDSNYTYRLPVVFHVLYKDENNMRQHIPYERLRQILEYVNNIYKGNVYEDRSSENINLEFYLADVDENGKKLDQPGVDYRKYDGDYPIDVEKFMSDQTGDNVKYIWEPNKYINVMMFNFKQDNPESITLGISHMPYSIKGGHELEGLNTVSSSNVNKSSLNFAYCSAINSLYAYSGNSFNNGGYYQSDRYTNGINQTTIIYRDDIDIVSTVAHELGHYLGLCHAFTEHDTGNGTEPVDSCGDTDYCKDTPSYNRVAYTTTYMDYLSTRQRLGISLTADDLLRRYPCDTTQTAFESTNIMDYSYTLAYKITKDQKERIRHVLYYSPLIPGPKLYKKTTRATAVEPGRMKIKIVK